MRRSEIETKYGGMVCFRQIENICKSERTTAGLVAAEFAPCLADNKRVAISQCTPPNDLGPVEVGAPCRPDVDKVTLALVVDVDAAVSTANVLVFATQNHGVRLKDGHAGKRGDRRGTGKRCAKDVSEW